MKRRLRRGLETFIEVVVILVMLFALAQIIALYFPEPTNCRCCTKHATKPMAQR